MALHFSCLQMVGKKELPLHSFFPILVKYGQERVYMNPYTLPCLNNGGNIGEGGGEPKPASVIQGGKSVLPLHYSLLVSVGMVT